MFLGKSVIQQNKAKRPLPGSLQTVVRSGEAPQMIPFSKFGNWQIQKTQSMEINQGFGQHMTFPKSQTKPTNRVN